jgi:nucleoside-diphosphate-sugar epimerase
MRVLVTGHRGYIGAHLVGLLQEAGHYVAGCDLDLFAGCGWEPMPEPDREIVCDVRSLTVRDLDGFDCVMRATRARSSATTF